MKKLLNILGPILLTLLVAWGTLEWGLRRFYQLIPLDVCASDPILGTYYCQPYFQYDKPVRIGYRYEPNLYFEAMWDPADPYITDVGPETRPSDRSDAFPYVFQTDEMGFPNAQPEWQDSYDIIITGDSFTTRTAPTTWIERLAVQTEQDILTLGAASWSTLNQVEAVKQWGLDKNPEWVILMYFEGNDLLNTTQYLERQASGLSWREYDMQGVVWWRRSVTLQWGRHLLTQPETAASPSKYRYPVTITTDVGEIDTVFKDVHLLALSGDYATWEQSDEFAAVAAGLLELKSLVAAQGANLLLVFIPSKEHVYWPRLWNEVDVNNVLERTVTVRLSDGDSGTLVWDQPIRSYDFFNAHYTDHEQLIADFANDNDFHFLNLTPIFTRKMIEEGEFFHYADPHWNQAGNDLVADTIADYLMGTTK